MPNWTSITIPETPSPNYVIVKNVSLKSNENTVKEFFLFCGKIKEFELTKDDDGAHQVALINFERESAAKTATLLSNALIDDCNITAAPYFSSAIPVAEDEGESATSEKEAEETSQEGKPKSRIAAEILANGYLLQDQIVAKGLDYDSKYGLSNRITGYLGMLQTNVRSIDNKYRIWDKAVELEQKYKIQEKVQTAAQSALQSQPGQRARGIAEQTFAQIAAVHMEATKIKTERSVKTDA
ncbi:hypothetical protein BDB00DRAFT_801288 [Zychaea mexicana]|uniref:uncharacterized protein n=1 Tax=Zychaea mexicana TaxID=64656 RepID=UPI0022FDCC87|nr:uncharacterized protein BDB00DRAFT_801288 [Zychaea mexicana]KAI9498143.1 hypothetical protein BDB00DRAFT_801288 [Zychaea mexicana]